AGRGARWNGRAAWRGRNAARAGRSAGPGRRHRAAAARRSPSVRAARRGRLQTRRDRGDARRDLRGHKGSAASRPNASAGVTESMNDINLNCARFEAQLSSWLDGELDAFSAAAMERHAADCAQCALLAADLRSIHTSAAALSPLTPSRDLWSGIEARIAAPVIPIGIAGPREQSGSAPARRRWMRPAAAAAALVLMTAGVTHLVETRVPAAPRAARVAS